MADILELPLASIEVGTDRARDLDPAWAEGLAGSIKVQGLLQPIIVREIDGAYHLVFGLHRLEAHRLLGKDKIMVRLSSAESDDAAKLEEVMENLARHELIAFDRCHHLYDLKQVWERMYPLTAHGKASPKTQTLRLSSDSREIFGFAQATAEKIGLSVRSIQLAVKIWTGLSPDSRRRLVGTGIASKQTELKALSELSPVRQTKVLDLILGDEEPENVSQALEHLESGSAPNALERKFLAVSKSIASLDDRTFDNVIEAHEDRVIASLKRRGRI